MDELSIMNVLIVIVIAVVLSVGSMIHFRRKRAAQWSGVVSKVKQKTQAGGTDENGSLNMGQKVWIIQCKLDSGGKKNLKLAPYQKAMLFPNGVEVGDRIVKEAGQDTYKLFVEED